MVVRITKVVNIYPNNILQVDELINDKWMFSQSTRSGCVDKENDKCRICHSIQYGYLHLEC